jgi:tRNA (guanine37-N1)-methyltransferase
VGHHANIRLWQKEQAEKITKEKRPDLWAKYTGRKSAGI